jgi:hypothetical protein
MKNLFNKTFLHFLIGFLTIIVLTFTLVIYIGDTSGKHENANNNATSHE